MVDGAAHAAVALLFVVRLLAGLGRVVNGVVHPSLLGDFYKPAE